MSRPRPTIKAQTIDRHTYRSKEVLAAQGIWAVFFDDEPINLRVVHLLAQGPGPKYKKVSFSNSGHAHNLARKLNLEFKTDKFTVVLLTKGTTVYPDGCSH